MIVRLLVAVILGLIAYFIAGLLDLDHVVAILIGLAVGLLVFFEDHLSI